MMKSRSGLSVTAPIGPSFKCCQTSAPVGVAAMIVGFVADSGLFFGLEVARELFWAPQLGKLGFGKALGVFRNAAAVLTGPHAGL